MRRIIHYLVLLSFVTACAPTFGTQGSVVERLAVKCGKPADQCSKVIVCTKDELTKHYAGNLTPTQERSRNFGAQKVDILLKNFKQDITLLAQQSEQEKISDTLCYTKFDEYNSNYATLESARNQSAATFAVVLVGAAAVAAAASNGGGGNSGYSNSYAPSYVGNCACPYNYDSAGNLCGARSAYSRSGGASPKCY